MEAANYADEYYATELEDLISEFESLKFELQLLKWQVSKLQVPQPNTKIKFATMNFFGQSGNPQKHDGKAKRRCDLLLPVIKDAAVVAIQECRSKTAVKEAVKTTHYVCMEANELTCILLKKDTFSRPTHDFQDLTFGDCMIACATPNGWEKSVLFVSYHAQKQGQIYGVVELVEWLKRQTVIKKADCIMIGGDFNIDMRYMKLIGLPEIMKNTGLQFHVTSCGPPGAEDKSVRHGKADIDYFLYNDALHVDRPTRKQFDERKFLVEMSYDTSEGDKYKQLQNFLDHDPIMTMVYRLESTTAPPEE